MHPTARDMGRSWIEFAARVPWWACVLLSAGASVLISGLEPRVMARAGGGASFALLRVVHIVVPMFLLGAGAVSIWGRMRQAALREVDVPLPNEAELTSAREAGRELAARGSLGLVLGGGGAKGAYQVGCWKALRACGVTQFGAIAGTSVGALNAVLVAQGDFEKAE